MITTASDIKGFNSLRVMTINCFTFKKIMFLEPFCLKLYIEVLGFFFLSLYRLHKGENLYVRSYSTRFRNKGVV